MRQERRRRLACLVSRLSGVFFWWAFVFLCSLSFWFGGVVGILVLLNAVRLMFVRFFVFQNLREVGIFIHCKKCSIKEILHLSIIVGTPELDW